MAGTGNSARLLPACLVAVPLFAVASGAAAASITVTSVLDHPDSNTADGECHSDPDVANCSLRAAVMQASVNFDDTSIVVPAGTYVLDQGLLNLSNNEETEPVITISGAGAGRTIVDANGTSTVLRTERTVEISGVTLRNGLGPNGAGILNSGSLTLSDSTVSGNTANTGSGGGIYNSGNLVVLRSTLSGNSAAIQGGGVYTLGAGTVEVIQSTISGNGATDGGGVYNSGTLYLVNSTVSQNHSIEDGGGIYNAGTLWTYNATMASNQAGQGGAFAGFGGGVFNQGTFNPRNSVIAGNDHFSPQAPDDCLGTTTGYGYNKFGTTLGCVLSHSGACGGSDSELDSLSELGPLQFNGGPTQTHAISAGSGLINGVQASCKCQDQSGTEFFVDQRGGSRAIVSPCDIGAFELGALASGLIFADGFNLGNLRAWS